MSCFKNMRFLFVFILIMMGISQSASAGTSSISVAIVKIQTSGCSDLYGTLVADTLSAELYSCKTFVLMDKSQMERIAKKSGVTDYDISSPERIANQGKILKVDKIIVGTIAQQDGFVLNIRSIDSQTAKIDIITQERFSDKSELDSAIQNSADKIIRFYAGNGNKDGMVDITCQAAFFIPAGSYSRYLLPSYGGMLTFSANSIGLYDVNIFADLGINRFTPKSERYKGFSQLFSTIGVSHRLYLFHSLILTPGLSAGSVWSQLDYDVDGKKSSEGFNYEKRRFQNFCVFFGAETSSYIYDRWMMSFTPGFMYIFDSTNSGLLFSVSIGVKTLF